jgi:hypothetical protein
MGIFKKQSIRLRREKWQNADELAEEIYGILNSDEPIEITSPVTINNTTGAPGLTINQHGDTDQGMVINRFPEPPTQFPDIPPFDFPDGVGTQIVIVINGDGTISTGSGPPGTTINTTTIETGGGGGFPGVVVSGSGDTYEVDVYESGLNESPTRRTVTQLQIAEDAEIPAGTWAMIGSAGESMFMQVPVWLEDLS